MGRRDNFKQTEVGMIPVDWDVKSLGEIAAFSNGKAHEQFIDDMGDYIVVNSKFISTQGTVSKNSNKCISPLKKGEITMVMSDVPNGKALARCFTIPKDNKYTLNQRICSVSSKSADNDFLALILNRNKYYLSFDSGTGQTNLRRQDVLECPLQLPPTKTEQTAIANALSNTDAWIQSLTRLIVKKHQIKQGALQTLLNPYKNESLKAGWVMKELGDCFNLSTGTSKSACIDFTGQYIVMDMGSVASNGQTIRTKKSNLADDFLNVGDLIMPKDDIGGGNIIGKVAYIDAEKKYILGDHVYRLVKKKKDLKPLFFYFLINSHYVSHSLKKKVAGSAQLGLGRKSVIEQEILYPEDTAVQNHIANILSDMDSEIAALESKLTKAQQIKQGMMQNLLTGHIRLVDSKENIKESA